MNIKNLENIEEKLKDSIKWARENLNPHQRIEITLDGIKIVSDELYVPLINKKKDNKTISLGIDSTVFAKISAVNDDVVSNYGQV